MKTQKKYHRLTSLEREEISRGLAQGESTAKIGGCLGRETSTISREVARNRLNSGYQVFSADGRAIERVPTRQRGKNRLAREHDLRTCVQRWRLICLAITTSASSRPIPARISSRSDRVNGSAGMVGTPLVGAYVNSGHRARHHAPTCETHDPHTAAVTP